MLTRKLLAILPILLCTSAVQAEPLNFVCNAPFGGTSQIREKQPAPSFRLSGRIEPRRLAERPAGTAQIDAHNFIDPTRLGRVEVMSVAGGDHVTLTITADPEGRTLSAVLLYSIDERVTAIDVGSYDGPVPGGRLSIPFAFLITPNSTLIQVEDRSFDLPMALTGEVDARASCRGANFNFSDLELTRSSAGESGQP